MPLSCCAFFGKHFTEISNLVAALVVQLHWAISDDDPNSRSGVDASCFMERREIPMFGGSDILLSNSFFCRSKSHTACCVSLTSLKPSTVGKHLLMWRRAVHCCAKCGTSGDCAKMEADVRTCTAALNVPRARVPTVTILP